MFENPVKLKLARGEAAFGASAGVAAEFAGQIAISTGVDFLWIDTEHSPFAVEDVGHVPILARRNGCMPMIRVAGLDPNLIKKALDTGASAVMLPQINNADEARLAVRGAKYPPQGTRGVSPNWTFYMNIPWDEYLPHANDETCVVVQIESPEGIRNVDEIAAVEGVDVVFAGPMDLSAALGVIGQIRHPSVREFLTSFPERVKAAGKTPGIAVGTGDAAAEAYEMGYRFINMGNLLFSGARGISADLARLRELDARSRAK
jgi:4-hydroxy-2-oxoheptanedioate aldolase